MARAVPPWLHRVCIRMHAPNDPWTKLLLLALNTFMNDSGEGFPGQESLARAASMGVSTVRAKLNAASRAGWIAVYARHRPGQQWKSYSYRTCVPDWIDLSEIQFEDDNGGASDGEHLADLHESKYGTIEPEAVRGTLYPQKGKKRAPPAHGGTGKGSRTVSEGFPNEAPPADDMKHRQPTEEAPPADGGNDRQPLREKSSLKSSGLSSKGEGAASSTAPFSGKGNGDTEFTRTRQLQTSASLQKVLRAPAPKDKAKWLYDDDELRKHVRKYYEAGVDPDTIVKALVQYADWERIRRMLKSEFGVPWCAV
jgi:hypothetical protein